MLAAFKKAERVIEDMPLDPEQMLLSMTDNFKIMYLYRLFFQQNDVIWRSNTRNQRCYATIVSNQAIRNSCTY